MRLDTDERKREIATFKDNFGSYSVGQFGEDLLVFDHFRRKTKIGFYVDAGAFHPRRYSNTFLLHRFLGWSGINIDGNPRVIEQFKTERPNDTNVCAALSSVEKDVEFVVYKGAAHSTLDTERKALNKNIEVSEVRKVRSQRLTEIVERHLPKGRQVDFLNIDLEGSDFDVLQSFDLKKYRPEMICVEDHGFLGALQGGKTTETFRYLRSFNYNVVAQLSVTSIYWSGESL